MKHHSYSLQAVMLLTALLLVGRVAYADETDIATAPLSSSSVDVVKPNVMFILDDSGSMDFAYMPDDVENFSGKYGFVSSQCNGVYYNPDTTYVPPIKDDGKTSYPNASFTDAWRDGYDTSKGKVNLSSNFEAINGPNYDDFRDHSGFSPQAAFYYIYTGNQTGESQKKYDTSSTFYQECNRSSGGPFTKVIVGATSGPEGTDERQNFANWYSYYRTRMQTMKTAAGLAFNDVGDGYRVGYSTINYTGTSSSDGRFLKISDFDTTQKAAFYEKLYGASTNGGTPLRGALAKAGRIYAGQLLTGENDPVQYSCQQNFTILSTDGYWNGAESNAVGIDGEDTVGNRDATELRPMYDGTVTANVTYTTATITFDGNRWTSKTRVDSITVGGTRITSGATSSTSDPRTLASRTADKISRNGYTATVSGNVVTIKAPTSAGAITYTPVVSTSSGNMSVVVTAFNTVTSQATSGGVSNSLADVAAYYYNTDLRTSDLGNCTGALGTGTDVCVNNVIGSGLDNKGSQHMTTFTLGLGANGTLAYSENYLGGGSSDYEKIKSGPDNWPTPQSNKPTAIDDLWHAAVNGRGTYFSAQTPGALVRGISKALTGAKIKKGSGAAAATSNLEPVQADNFLFLATYRTSLWDGDLQAKTIDPSSGAVSDTANWSAQEKLDARAASTRTIYTFSESENDKLKTFTWDNLSADEKAYFNNMCSPTVKLSQCNDTTSGPNLTTAQKDLLSGPLLLNFVRGETGNEDQANNANPLYRDREHVLGDMIGSQPVYVKAPPFSYADDNYAAFKTAKKDRLAMVYVAANDGMLHAFDATIDQAESGTEKWAYIPPMVLPNLYKLADKNYAANHQYYVDGAPTAGDICPSAPASRCTANQWKSILVGGLNFGGKGYYALDITDPASPKALWNFTTENDPDIGYSYGNPVITKRQDGTWVVVFSSGYNNHTDGGDGKGHLYVLNANTGEVLEKLNTTAGDTATPSGLAKINAWIDSTADNTAKRFYGGDLLGNIWRFDPDDRIGEEGNKVTLLAQLGNVSPAGTQSVTIKPELTEVTYAGSNYAVVNVATGRYLGINDLTDTSIQSIYALKDNLTETGLGKVRTPDVLVQQTLTASEDGSTRTTSNNAVNWGDKSGWYMDLNPDNQSPGERVNVDMQQQLGLLTVAGNVPENNACTPGGYAWIYSLDFKTGQFVEGASGDVAGRRISGLVAGLKTLKLTTGKTVTVVTDTSGSIKVLDDPSSNPGGGNGARRVSWRELIAD